MPSGKLVDHIKLRTHSARLLFILFIGFQLCAVLYSTQTVTDVRPDTFYYYTVRSNLPEPNSPTGKQLFDVDIQPSHAGYNEEASKRYKIHCGDINDPDLVGAASFEGIYRGVYLCNFLARFDKAEFNVANSYFQTQIDSKFHDYYFSIANGYAANCSLGFAIWIAVICLIAAMRWIRNGTTKTV